MIFPPAILRIRIQGRGQHRLGWWLPLFLLWPLLFAATLLAPLFLFFRALFGGGWERSLHALEAWGLFLLLFCRARRLHVHARTPQKDVLVALY